jgi:hypothetical protein
VLSKRGRGAGTRLVKRAVHDVGESISRTARQGSGQANPNVTVRTPKNRGELERLRRGGAAVVSAGEANSLTTPGLGTVGRTVQGVARGFAANPKSATVGTVKGVRDMIVGAPAGIVKTIVDPKGTAKSIAADYKRRYGGINTPGGVDRLAARIEKEGAAAEIADAISLGVPIGKAVNEALGAGARRGVLGGRLAEQATRARPAMRTSGGAADAQAKARTLTGIVRQNRRDTRARRTINRTVDKADEGARRQAVRDVEGAPRGSAPLTDARRPRGAVDAVVREAHKHGDVVPTSLGGRRISHRKIEKRQRTAYAREKGRALHEQRAEQRTEISRGSARVLAGLNRNERRAFKTAMQVGNPESPEAGARAVRARINLIMAARAAGHDIGTEGDELPTLQRILENPRAHFTPRLQRAVMIETERGARLAEGDPRMGANPTERALRAHDRAMAPQAQVLDVARGGTPIRDAERGQRAATRTAKARRTRAGRRVERAGRRVDRERGRAEILVGQATRRDESAIARAERAVAIHERAAANHRRRAERARQDGTRTGHNAKADAAEERADRAQARADAIKKELGTKPRPTLNRLNRAVQNERLEGVRQGKARAAVGESKAAERDLRAARRRGEELDPRNAEPMPEFRGRVSAAAKGKGLERPGYFPSRKRERVRFSPFTTGGARRAKPDKRYRGRLFAAGREANGTTEYHQALAQNIKGAHNWGLITRTIGDHAIRGLTGVKYGEAVDRAARQGVDLESVRFVDMDAFESRLHDHATEGGPVHEGVNPIEHDIHQALQDSMVNPSEGGHLQAGAGRLVALPKGIADELLADTKPSGVFGRSLDILKGKQARIMLGLSPAWLQFQVVANALQAGMATKALPHEWVIANVKWWRGLSPAQKKAIEPYVGIGSFHDAIDTPRMGAAATGGLVNGYRAFKAHPFWHAPRGPLRGAAISQLNPLDVLFRLDNAQNNFFRRAVLYNRLKREAYDRMGKNMSVMMRTQDKILGAAPKDAKAMIDQLINERGSLEKGAEAVRDFLGDYATKTAKERRWLDRNIMFYGYLRFSLRFAFYTMPVKHPVMTAIIGQLGRLNTDEVRKLLGGDELPYSLGKLYFTKGGKIQSIDLSRANPALNALTGALATRAGEKGIIRSTLQAALQVLPPMFVSALDVAMAKSSFKDKPLKVDEESTARPNKQGQAINDRQALEYVLASAARLAAPYRLAEKRAADGRPMSDNSLLFKAGPFGGQKYTHYRDPSIRGDVARARGDSTPGQIVLHELLPLLPRPDRSVDVARRIRRARGQASPGVVRPQDAAAADEAQRMIDTYGGGGASSSAPDPRELQRLVDTYSR